jgi:nicotinamidase/pyrazinamidase
MTASDHVLIVVDVQNDFCAGGALSVPDGDAVVPVINALALGFQTVVLTQDWHPAGHISFASSHAGRNPFDVIELPYGPQVLWPDHCVQGTAGAAFHPKLIIPHAQMIVRKGFRPHIDSYSGFLEADRRSPTGLAGYLTERGIKAATVVGLATDYCVAWTALDARAAGLDVTIVDAACRAIDAGGSLAKANAALAEAGVKRA